jgi:hypothetical protein
MVDECFNTWVLEINKSPSMDTNTVRLYNLGSDQAHRGPRPGGHRQSHRRLRHEQETQQEGN